MELIKTDTNYLNPYEEMYNTVSKNPLFKKDVWDLTANTGDLGAYITMLSETNKIKDIDKFKKEYNYDYNDAQTNLWLLNNELYADRETLKDRETYETDTKGNVISYNGAPVIKKYQATDYDYYKELIKQNAQINYQKHILQLENEEKENRNNFLEGLRTWTAGIASGLTIGATQQIDNISNFFVSLYDGITGLFKGESFSDNIANTAVSGKGRLFENIGITDALVDFERRYTNLRDIYGNYTSLGKVLGNTCTSFGQMLPSMAFSAIPLAGPVASKFVFYAGVTSNSLRENLQNAANQHISLSTGWALTNAVTKSICQAGVEELLDLVPFFGGSSTLDQVVYGKTLTSAVGKTIGKTAQNITKELTKKGITRIAKDFVHEGLEEVLQDTSDYLIDRLFSLGNQYYADLTDWTWQGMMDSFIIGGLSSFAGHALKLGKLALSGQQVELISTDISSIQKDIDTTGDIQAENIGDYVKTKKMNVIASNEYYITLQSFIENANELINGLKEVETKYKPTDKQYKTYKQAMTELYASFRILSDVYNNIGEERVKTAGTLLNNLQNMIDKSEIASKQTKDNVEKMNNFLTDVGENYLKYTLKNISEYSNEYKDKIKKEVKEIVKDANIKDAGKEIKTQEDVEQSDYTDAEKAALRDLINGTKKHKKEKTEKDVTNDTKKQKKSKDTKIVVTETGSKPVQIGDTIITPKQFIQNGTNKEVLNSLAEDRAVNAVITGETAADKQLKTVSSEISKNNKITPNALNKITDLYKTFSKNNNVVTEDAVRELLYNPDFASIVAKNSTNDTYQLLANLNKIVHNIIPQNEQDEIFKQKFYSSIKAIKQELIQQLLLVQDVDINMSIFTEAEKKFILSHRYEINLVNKCVQTGKLDKNDIDTFIKLYDNSEMSLFEKSNSKLMLNSTNSRNVIKAILNICNYYKNRFYTKFDNNTYFIENNIQAMIVNRFLQRNSLTIKDLTIANENIKQIVIDKYGSDTKENVLKYRNTELNQFSKGTKITLDKNGNFEINSKVYNKNINYIADLLYPSLDSDKKRNIENVSTFVTPKSQQLRLNEYVDEKLDKVTKNMITINDLVIDNTLLSEKTKKEIIKEYREITPFTTLAYLKTDIIKKSNGMNTLLIMQNGKIVIGDLSSSNNVLKSNIDDKIKNTIVLSKKSNNQLVYPISDFVNENFVTENMKNLQIVVKYDPNSTEFGYFKEGSIYIIIKDTNNISEIKTTIIHEFQHCVQYFNNLQMGSNMNILNSFTEKTRNKLIKDKFFEDAIKSIIGYKQFIETNEDKNLYKDLLANILYLSTGETDAYGWNTAVKFYPIIVNSEGVQLPNGHYYKFDNFKPSEQENVKIEYVTKLPPNVSMMAKQYTPKTDKDTDYIYNPDKDAVAQGSWEYMKPKLDENGNVIKNRKGEIQYETVYPNWKKAGTKKEDTNMYKFGYSHKYGKRTYTKDFTNFVNSLGDGTDINNDLYQNVSTGKMNTQKIKSWFRDTDLSKITNKTFDLIVKNFYKNDNIKTKKQLDTIVTEAADIYAIYRLFNESGVDVNKFLKNFDVTDSKQIAEIVNKLETSVDLKTKFDKLRSAYYGYFSKGKGKHAYDTNEKALKIKLLYYFTGDIESAYSSIVQIKGGEKLGYFTKEIETSSISKGKSGEKEMTLEDTLGGNVDFENSIDKPISDVKSVVTSVVEGPEDLNELDRIMVILTPSVGQKVMKGELTIDEASQELKELREKYQKLWIENPTEFNKIAKSIVNGMTDTQIENAFRILTNIEENNIKITEDNVNEAFEVVLKNYPRTAEDSKRNINSILKTINRNLSTNDIKRILKYNEDLFEKGDKGIKLKDDLLYIDDNGKQVLRSLDEIKIIEDRIRTISEDAKKGEYKTLKAKKAFEKTQRQLDKARNEIMKLKLEKAKLIEKNGFKTIKDVKIKDDTISVNTNMTMPTSLENILSKSFEQSAESKTKFLTDIDEKHVKMDSKEFYKVNAQELNSLNSEDANQIIDYYLNTEILPGTNKARQYLATELYLLGYIEEGYKQNKFLIDDEKMKQMHKRIEQTISISAAALSTWQAILKKFSPEQVVMSQMARTTGIEFTEQDVKPLTDAIASGDIKKIQTEKEKLYKQSIESFEAVKKSNITKLTNKFWKKYATNDMKGVTETLDDLEKDIQETFTTKDKNGKDLVIDNKTKLRIETARTALLDNIKDLRKAISEKDDATVEKLRDNLYYGTNNLFALRRKTFLEQLLNFERMAMLSGPGTWARNYVSNFALVGLNKASEKTGSFMSNLIGKLFKEKDREYSAKQYKIIGTQIDENAKNFIEANVIESGLFDVIKDGLIKYDFRKTTNSTSTGDVLTKMIVTGLQNEIFRYTDIKSDKFKKVYDLFMKCMSDDKFINKRATAYLGKMLTEDKTDLSKGVTKEILQKVADAYILASQEYMHKATFFTNIERDLASKHPNIYFAYKQLFPFANASFNWFMEGLNYTPIGLIKGILNFGKLENSIDKLDTMRQKGETAISSKFARYLAIKQIGKGTLGTIGLGIGILLSALGVAKIDKKDDKYKLKLGDVYVDISDLFGTQSILAGMAAGSIWFGEDKSFNNAIKGITTSLDNLFQDSLYSDFYNLFRYNPTITDFISYMPEKMLGMMTPNFIKQVTKIITGGRKTISQYDSGLIGKIEKYVSNTVGSTIATLAGLPTKIDPYTGETQVTYKIPYLYYLTNFLPVKVSQYNVSDLEKEAISLGIYKSNLTGKYTVNNKQINLSAKDVQSINTFYGKLNNKYLTELMNNKTKYKIQQEDGTYKTKYYRQMDDKEKASIIKRIMNNNADYSKIFILTQKYNYKYYTSQDEYKILKKIGATKNIFVSNKDKGFK